MSRRETNRGALTSQCLGCGESFTLSVRDIRWYRQEGLDLPKRCAFCRRRRRVIKLSKDGPGSYHLKLTGEKLSSFEESP